MANFNPADYETVDSRIKRFYVDHPDGRITTELVEATGEVGGTRWIVKASIWRKAYFVDPSNPDPFQVATGPDGTGYAFEVDGTVHPTSDGRQLKVGPGLLVGDFSLKVSHKGASDDPPTDVLAATYRIADNTGRVWSLTTRCRGCPTGS